MMPDLRRSAIAHPDRGPDQQSRVYDKQVLPEEDLRALLRSLGTHS